LDFIKINIDIIIKRFGKNLTEKILLFNFISKFDSSISYNESFQFFKLKNNGGIHIDRALEFIKQNIFIKDYVLSDFKNYLFNLSNNMVLPNYYQISVN
jgi:hypothetical protein